MMGLSLSQHPLSPPASSGSRRPFPVDRVLVYAVALVGVLALLFLLLVPRFFLPAEDAVILFQFSRNLAHTGAITFIPNGPRAEGATDFAWMALLAGGIKLGLDPFWLIAVLNVFSLAALGWLLFKMAKVPPRPLALLFIAGAFGLMPQLFAAASGFSTLPFACLLVLLFVCFNGRKDVATPLTALLLCLFRPDGVVFAVPLLLAAFILYPNRPRRLLLDTLCFVLPGSLYFVWRWWYFGHLLPLPFLVKSNAERFGHVIVVSSMQEGLLLCILVAVVLFVALRKHAQSRESRVILLCVVILPNLFYFAMRLDQNIGRRFFVYLPVGAAILLAMNWQEIRPRASLLLRTSLVVLLVLLPLTLQQATSFWSHNFDNRRAIAQDLAALPAGTMLVTEAGILPFYSHWKAYDAWGLNTEEFASHLILPSDVSTLHPDLLLVYTGVDLECTKQADWQTPYTERTWLHMTRNLIDGAASNGYELWLLPFGSSSFRKWHYISPAQGDQECWLVASDSSLRPALETILANHGGRKQLQAASNAPIPLPPTQLSRPPRSRIRHLLGALFGYVWNLLYG